MNYTDRVEVYAKVLHETEKAFKVTTDDGDDGDGGGRDVGVWIPKSQVECSPGPAAGETIVFDMPEWLAYDKGLI